jgi:hypothetical protein
MYCLLLVLLEEAVTDVLEPLAPEEGQETERKTGSNLLPK